MKRKETKGEKKTLTRIGKRSPSPHPPGGIGKRFESVFLSV